MFWVLNPFHLNSEKDKKVQKSSKKVEKGLTSSVPSPDIAKRGVLAELVPLLLSRTMAPFAPTLSKRRAFSKKKKTRLNQMKQYSTRLSRITKD
jgi:hypothetical protein